MSKNTKWNMMRQTGAKGILKIEAVESKLPKLVKYNLEGSERQEWLDTKIRFARQFNLKKKINEMHEIDEDFADRNNFDDFEEILLEKVQTNKQTEKELSNLPSKKSNSFGASPRKTKT